MPTLVVDNFNIVCACLGGFISIFGLISYLLKETFYLSEALISTIFGIVFSPHATNFIKPLEYANQNAVDLETITLYFSRLVLGVQLVLAGVQLPSKYLWKERKSLSILLGPGMCVMWIVTSMLVWALVPNIEFLLALAVGACVTPTDPVLSNSIVKGKFADKNIPPALQKVIVAESGANDGLGYPFLYLALYLLQYTHDGGAGQSGGAGRAMALWFYETWAYTILMSVAYGAVVGWIAKDLLHWAEERRYVDRESFLVFAITLALFIVGTVGMIGSDDLLACFIAGNAFTWDDWFRLETMDDSLQPTIDMLLNVAIFMWFGAVCPWHSFVSNDVIPIYRLIPLGIMVLLFRRLPMVLFFHKVTPTLIHQIEDSRRALFTGFFGPIGVSAIFYLYITRDFLRDITVDGVQRPDAAKLSETINVVVWFLVVCSIVGHGLSIPLAKLAFYLPRTLSTAISSERVSRTVSQERDINEQSTPFRRSRAGDRDKGPGPAGRHPLSLFFSVLIAASKRLGYDIKKKSSSEANAAAGRDNSRSASSTESDKERKRPSISAPLDGRPMRQPVNFPDGQVDLSDDQLRLSETGRRMVVTQPPVAVQQLTSAAPSGPAHTSSDAQGTVSGSSTTGWQRQIRFPDEVVSAPPTVAQRDQGSDGD